MRGRPEVALLLDGGELLAAPRMAPLLLEGLHALARERRANGAGLPPAAVELADLLTAAKQGLFERAQGAPTAVSTAAAVRSEASSGEFCQVELVDPIDAREAARMLGTRERNVRDLCSRDVFLTARKTPRGWRVERAEVLERRAG